jgi:hypothetical protein
VIKKIKILIINRWCKPTILIKKKKGLVLGIALLKIKMHKFREINLQN